MVPTFGLFWFQDVLECFLRGLIGAGMAVRREHRVPDVGTVSPDELVDSPVGLTIML